MFLLNRLFLYKLAETIAMSRQIKKRLDISFK